MMRARRQVWPTAREFIDAGRLEELLELLGAEQGTLV